VKIEVVGKTPTGIVVPKINIILLAGIKLLFAELLNLDSLFGESKTLEKEIQKQLEGLKYE
jgi:hypothetical protein